MTDILIWILILMYFMQVISFFRAAKQFKRMLRIFNKVIDYIPDHTGSTSPELPDQEASHGS